MTDHILVERQGAIQIIRMNRPDKKNALTRAMYAKMSAALADQSRIALCRFFAENLLGEVSALKQRIVDGADSLAVAGKTLISA